MASVSKTDARAEKIKSLVNAGLFYKAICLSLPLVIKAPVAARVPSCGNIAKKKRLDRPILKKENLHICLRIRNYKFHKPEGVCFVSFAVVDWLDSKNPVLFLQK
jgi:hypothetical protein